VPQDCILGTSQPSPQRLKPFLLLMTYVRAEARTLRKIQVFPQPVRSALIQSIKAVTPRKAGFADLELSTFSEVLKRPHFGIYCPSIDQIFDLWGTLARIVVPRWSCDSMARVPFRSFKRSCILMRPSPRLALAAVTSKPTPESAMVR
jgi:hypothetical protein